MHFHCFQCFQDRIYDTELKFTKIKDYQTSCRGWGCLGCPSAGHIVGKMEYKQPLFSFVWDQQKFVNMFSLMFSTRQDKMFSTFKMTHWLTRNTGHGLECPRGWAHHTAVEEMKYNNRTFFQMTCFVCLTHFHQTWQMDWQYPWDEQAEVPSFMAPLGL